MTNKINYKCTKLHYLGWQRGKGEILAGIQCDQGLQWGRHCRSISVSLQESMVGSAGLGALAWAQQPLCQVPPPSLHRHPLWGLLPAMVLCTLPVGCEICLGSVRSVAVSPILKGFSCLLVMQPCCVFTSSFDPCRTDLL